ncbi:contact-dependent growth inhibition system immunity protein [Curtobacterium aurantiacum]|uniref:CdiI immunity protein domain-containing protein n=1 Tax=Curtobacterium aurantiacum TaxID=3236919 RepID=A0ABS5VJ82_9MICO|nr:hypothetical protein [Curtobacterium flaccumfaciens pv. flaccumfaciens]MBT1589544.1 hypothetical protein [Curtobacterium flaccumfaciens pv. flaccumfaciens]
MEGLVSEYRTELREYPLVRDLLGAVFDQDWREHCNGVENVCEDLLDDEPHHLRSARVEPIEAFLATRSETEADEVIRASETGVGPRAHAGMSGRGGCWLCRIVCVSRQRNDDFARKVAVRARSERPPDPG